MDDLERELRDLSAWLDTPPAPAVAARVRRRLAAAPNRRWRYYLAAGLAALLVAVLPPGRAAVADAVTGLLRVAGIVVTTTPGSQPPTGSPSPLPAQRTVTPADVQRQVRFPIRLPSRLGPPEQVLVADPDGTGAHRVATVLWRGGALRLDAFDGRLDPVFLKQAGGPGVKWVQVGGDFGVWVAGPHPLTYVDRTGTTRAETARLAASTLIWERGGVSYRLEGDLTEAEAIAVAASLR